MFFVVVVFVKGVIIYLNFMMGDGFNLSFVGFVGLFFVNNDFIGVLFMV